MQNWGVALFLGFLLTTHANAQALPRSSLRHVKIPFELVSDFLVVVRGQAGDLDGLKFILDTGSTNTWIDQRVADRLQLRRRPGRIMNFDRDIPVEWAEIAELRVGPIRVESLRVTVARLREYSELAAGVDGIIGLDVLHKSRKLFINYETRTVSLELADADIADRSSPACFVVRLAIQGFPMRLALDTGFQGILLYQDRLRKGLPDLHTEGEAAKMRMGRLQGVQVKLPGVRIFGPEAVESVFLIDGPDSKEMSGVDGYLGIAALHAKRIEFDFVGQRLRWQ